MGQRDGIAPDDCDHSFEIPQERNETIHVPSLRHTKAKEETNGAARTSLPNGRRPRVPPRDQTHADARSSRYADADRRSGKSLVRTRALVALRDGCRNAHLGLPDRPFLPNTVATLPFRARGVQGRTVSRKSGEGADLLDGRFLCFCFRRRVGAEVLVPAGRAGRVVRSRFYSFYEFIDLGRARERAIGRTGGCLATDLPCHRVFSKSDGKVFPFGTTADVWPRWLSPSLASLALLFRQIRGRARRNGDGP